MTFHRTILTILAATALAGCGNRTPQPPERLPDAEIPAYRQAAMKMMPYISLEDSAFSVTISADSAASLGVPRKYYDRITQELKYTNHIIRQHNRNGLPIDMSEYGELQRP